MVSIRTCYPSIIVHAETEIRSVWVDGSKAGNINTPVQRVEITIVYSFTVKILPQTLPTCTLHTNFSHQRKSNSY